MYIVTKRSVAYKSFILKIIYYVYNLSCKAQKWINFEMYEEFFLMKFVQISTRKFGRNSVYVMFMQQEKFLTLTYLTEEMGKKFFEK